MRLQIHVQVTIHVDLKKTKQSDKKLYPYLHIDVTGITDHESKNQILYLKYKICY